MHTSEKTRTTRRHRERLLAVLAFGLAVVAARTFVLDPVAIQGVSMEPTVADGDVALVSQLTDVARDVRRGDLVVFHDPAGTLALKRVVGLPGDRVSILDAVLTVNGRPVDEPYVDLSRIDGLYVGETTVPARHVFVLGDNRGRSIDSRDYGPVDDRGVVGEVLMHW